jgi:DNA-binding ferritin-like protein
MHKINQIDALYGLVTNDNGAAIEQKAASMYSDVTPPILDDEDKEIMAKLEANPNMPIDETDGGGKRSKRSVGKRSKRSVGKRSKRSRSKRSRSKRSKRSVGKHSKRMGTKSGYSPNGIVATMTEMLHTIKLYHWRTHSYSEHKATDNLHEALSEQVDSFVEKLLGSKHTRATLTHMPLNACNTLPGLKQRIEYYKQYLKRMPASLGTDLLNIRDELLGSLNQFSYMLSLH